jgi:hypothetical protein
MTTPQQSINSLHAPHPSINMSLLLLSKISSSRMTPDEDEDDLDSNPDQYNSNMSLFIYLSTSLYHTPSKTAGSRPAHSLRYS